MQMIKSFLGYLFVGPAYGHFLQLSSHLKKKRRQKIYIYGLNGIAAELANRLDEAGMSNYCYVDGRKGDENFVFRGQKVNAPEVLFNTKEQQKLVVLCMLNGREDVKNKLKENCSADILLVPGWIV